MTASATGRAPRRVVIGLSSAGQIAPAVAAATTLAKAMEAELVGLFVEDEGVIDLAGLPFAQALNPSGGQALPLEPDAVMKAFSRAAANMRHCLSASARDAKLRWSFSLQRGKWRQAVTTAAARNDFVVLCGEPTICGVHIQRNEMRGLLAGSHGLLVTARTGPALSRGPVIVFDDGDVLGEGTIRIGLRIARALDVPVKLYAIARDAAAADAIFERASRLCPPGTGLTMLRFPPGAGELLVAAAVRERPSFLVADLEGEPFNDDKAARRIFNAAGAPVVFLGRDHETEHKRDDPAVAGQNADVGCV